jgi:hypothetical protein
LITCPALTFEDWPRPLFIVFISSQMGLPCRRPLAGRWNDSESAIHKYVTMIVPTVASRSAAGAQSAVKVPAVRLQTIEPVGCRLVDVYRRASLGRERS